MPETIKQMSKHDRDEFLKATKSGTAQRYYIRVMIVGESSAGKTCLLRRLMNKPIDDVISTDGLDIERRKCQVDVKTRVWHFKTIEKDILSIWSRNNEQFADCGFWDFAGQKEFYATHQTFLSANAVYLLAVDISKEFSKKTYNDMLEDKFEKLGEYIDFWLDNVHCYWTEVGNTSNQYNPPVVIVGTGIDKIELNKREDSQTKFQDHLGKILSVHEKRRHLRKIHFLSNKFPSDNGEEFIKLREEILYNAETLKNWVDNLPSRWIVLEKEIYTKISEERFTMSYDEAIQLATDCSFPNLKQTTAELDSFLKYEHDIGNIIFFEDVKDFIVLDPKWLVDVFKCFVSNQYEKELIHMTEWSELKNKGKLSNTLIEGLLEKVPHLSLNKHKQFVLQIMEKFDIIVKTRNNEASEIFYMPCMIKTETVKSIFKEMGAENCKKITSWFILEFVFLPPSFFNHILVSFVKDMNLSIKRDNQLCIYRNIGLFDLNKSRTRVLMICLSQNAIAMQVLQWNLESHCYSDIKNRLIHLVELMKQRYRINITYTKKLKCSEGNCLETEGRVGFDTLLEEGEYRCTEDKNTHSSTETIKSWLTDKEIEKYHGQKKCSHCVMKSVYWCYECRHILCKDCLRTHNEGNKNQTHSIQPTSDRYKVIFKFCLVGHKTNISNINCLSDELLVATTNEIDKELVIFSVNGHQIDFKPLEGDAISLAVLDKDTVVVSKKLGFSDFDLTKIIIQKDKFTKFSDKFSMGGDRHFPLKYTEQQLFIALHDRIKVTGANLLPSFDDIHLEFTPGDMCYNDGLQRWYCVDSHHSRLICLNRDWKEIFTFTDSKMKYAYCLDIDNDGNVLVLCQERNNSSGCVIMVNSDGTSCQFVISNIQLSGSYLYSCMCYHRYTNSLVIGVDGIVYVYRKEAEG